MSRVASTVRLLDEPIDLPGLPDGLQARPLRQYRRDEDGDLVEVRDRRGRRKLDLVALTATREPTAAGAAPTWPAGVSAEYRVFVLGARRRAWSTVVGRCGEQAWPLAVALARGGAIRVVCRVDDRVRLGAPVRWELTDAWREAADAGRAGRREVREAWRSRAVEAAGSVRDLEPTLAAALETTEPGSPASRVLVHAAEDLVGGVTHDGPRAFSQTHFGDTKAHGNVDAVLREAGVPAGARQQLGVHRSQRLGLAGPVVLKRQGSRVDLSLLDGLVELRADQPGITVACLPGTALVVVENLQAAEVLADRQPELAIAYTAGVPGEASLAHLASLAQHAGRVAIAPDADAGGVRIAEAIMRSLPDGVAATLLDVGISPHRMAAAWSEDSQTLRTLRRAVDGPAGALARACLVRGYPVEQEATTLAVVDQWLRGCSMLPP